MYDPSSGEIEKPTAEREPLVPVRGQPPTLVPGDVRHDRVHEGRQQARQQEVGDHVAPLGDRARDDRRGRRRETQPEEPLRLPPKARLPNRRGVDVAKAGRAEDAVGARISKAVVAVRDGVAHDPPARRADGDVHDVFKQYLFRVILRAGADFQHGEALLHRENPDGRDEQEERVDNRLIDVARMLVEAASRAGVGQLTELGLERREARLVV
mmetsp:Transcript_1718/g.4919  ORF Transcript_1718/g.4919 Transcript_1718/m.4919 type:complete len:212 (-) Transcript_1718:159-794(-)